jgi:putative methanogenesis marker 16 metalloprotein
MKSVEEIREKIRRGTAEVWTAAEFKQRIREGGQLSPGAVDVVTTGTCGVMSGTAAVLSIPVAGRGSVDRAETVRLNGVPAFPGPCPNERLGIVDVIVYGTARAGPRYGGGHLFRDLVEGREIEVFLESGGRIFEDRISRDDLGSARLITTRSAYRNYTGFVNPRNDTVCTIFSVNGLKGPLREVSVSGCGEINPLENDPAGRYIRAGAPVLLNGAPGWVMGEGTRSTADRPNIAVSADMSAMQGRYMGGFVTSGGPECITSVAAAIPVCDDSTIAALSVLNESIPLPLMDIHERVMLGEATYGDVWGRTGLRPAFLRNECLACPTCTAEQACPVGAFSAAGGIDSAACFGCGTCVQRCEGGAFVLACGRIAFRGRKLPITLRQSDLCRGMAICDDLKERILDGEFPLPGGA